MSLRVAFDLDGVFADLDGALRGIATQLFGAATSVQALSPEQWERVWCGVRQTENFWERLREIEPGSVRRLADIANRLGWEVIFLTQRSSTAGDLSQVQSQRWLERHGFRLPSVFVVSGSRAEVASALQLNIVVDDDHRQCVDLVSEAKVGALLVWRQGEPAVRKAAERLGLAVVDSVNSGLDLLEQIDSIVSTPPIVPQWLKRTLRF